MDHDYDEPYDGSSNDHDYHDGHNNSLLLAVEIATKQNAYLVGNLNCSGLHLIS